MNTGFTEPAKKHLGQNFLHDRSVIDRIVQAIDPRPGDVVVEIGPGQGALTFPLLKKHGEVTAIEFDRDLHAPLQAAAREHGKLQLIEGDVLGVDFSALAAQRGDARGQIRLAGNLPYNLSSPILFHALDHAAAIRDMHFMLQKEVVERMVAAPGSAAYGRLSVMLQYRFDMELLFIVPPTAFVPAPKVDSAIVRMTPKPASALEARDPAHFAALVSAAFSQRRKMLRNTLRDWSSAEELEQLGVAATARAEELALADYVRLSNALQPGSP